MIKKKSKKENQKPWSFKKFLLLSLSFCAVSGVSLGLYVWHWESRPHVLEINSLLIDGNIVVFIQTPDNHTILIDSGKTDAVVRAITSRMPFYRRTIDAVILTKPDDSHVAGLISVLDRYHVGRVIEPISVSVTTASASTPASTSQTYLTFEKIIAEKNIKNEKAKSGDILSIGDISFHILFPSTDFKFSKTNMPVLAVAIQYGQTTFVVSDISKSEQKYVASSSTLLAMTHTVLISQHAGSTGTVYENFFNSIHPEYVVIAKKLRPSAKTITTKKIPKPPFSIFDATSTSIINLIQDGNNEFISDGVTISIKK